ncbi:MAG: CYTH domain-containing protein [Gammaproteobacteria bacterium]
MPLEIERKYLVRNYSWRMPGKGTRYRQGYLSTDPTRTVRVRVAAGRGFITVKGVTVNITRPEYEYPIPVEDANEMLDTLCLKPIIEKIRYPVEHAGLLWEVDEFEGENAGLVIAEVELARADQTVILPDWIGEEVTDDARYYNASLIANPFTTWGNSPPG